MDDRDAPMDQVHIDELFEHANAIISALPVTRDPDSFYFIVDVTSQEKRFCWQSASEALLKISEVAPAEKKSIFLYWVSNVYIGLGDLESALQLMPQTVLGSRNSNGADTILSLKLATGKLITGVDIATLFGPKLTNFGKVNIAEIVKFLDAKIGKLQEHDGRNLILEWADDAYLHPIGGMPLFNGHASYIITKHPPSYSFSLSPTAEAMCCAMMREAENTFREERDIPKIGEGWVAETILYYTIKDAFPEEIVLQHGRPKWLGRQHLDVYFPERKIALEYQGEQHDRPIAFFGGDEAYTMNIERDIIKACKCNMNGVRIIYVRKGYSISEIINIIRNSF